MTTRFATSLDSTRLEGVRPLLHGLNHEQEFDNIEQVLPIILDFLRGERK